MEVEDNLNKEEEKMKMDNNKPHECQEHFRLFSYLSMAILTIAILVGLFLMIQHLSEEAINEQTLANQESVIKNQELLLKLNQNQSDNIVLSSILINETRRDNAKFFAILANMTEDLQNIKKDHLDFKTNY